MSLVFETIQTEGLAEISYLIGDDEEGIAAVFDPRADVDVYLELARAKNVAITHIFETHIHADLVSGARELQGRVESAKIYVSHEGGARYGFENEKVSDGDTFNLGSVIITARHTPGHTPEHVSYLLADAEHPEIPWGVLSGDSLFVNSAGRPDLLGGIALRGAAPALGRDRQDGADRQRRDCDRRGRRDHRRGPDHGRDEPHFQLFAERVERRSLASPVRTGGLRGGGHATLHS